MAIYRITPDRDRPNGWQILDLFNIPVFVEPSFLFLLGLYFLISIDGSGRTNLPEVGLWCFVVFISLLVHEYGHALTSKAVGCERIRISLWIGGGLAYHSPTTTGRSLLIIAAGPAFGFLLGLAAYFVMPFVLPRIVGGPSADQSGPMHALWFVLANLFWVNIFWNFFNLIPIHPLDGGQGLFHLLTYFIDHNTAMLFVSRLSMVLCVVVGIIAYKIGLTFTLLFLLQFFVSNLEISRVMSRMR